jgi:PIN domain nuclease of toxin-antitoxin system
MGNYLLDTHAAIWFLNGDTALSQTAKQIILDPSNNKYISIASAWELAIKISLGKLKFNGKSAGFIQLAQNNGFIFIPIDAVHLTIVEGLPSIHRDPFDRVLIATAIAQQMTLITTDEDIARYSVSQIW